MKFILSVIFMLTLVACSHAPTKESKSSPRTIALLSDQCLMTRNLAKQQAGLGVASVVLPYILDYGISYVAKKLSEVKKVESASEFYAPLYASNEGGYPEFDPRFKCVTVVTANTDFSPDGYFSLPKNQKVTVARSPAQIRNNVDTRELAHKILIDAKIIKSERDFYSVYEFELVNAQDDSAFRVKDRYLLVDKLLTGKNKSNVVYTLTVSGPGVSENGVTLSSLVLNLGGVEKGTRKEYEDISTNLSGLYKTIGISPESWMYYIQNIAGKNHTGYTGLMDSRVAISMVQINKPSEAAKFVANFLENNKSKISKAITAKAFPEDNTTKILESTIAAQSAKIEFDSANKGTTQCRLAKNKIDLACSSLTTLGGDKDVNICMNRSSLSCE
ncbi:hypothetical protein [uncultured Pseudoteredinibacter sp.]|uniref:hypothetical protein n=1 Tax=uncultured Pseudoteredinibacter sp. TaxID=1641701 RepID=UPI002615B8C5|nr:hypothetical protein [uncultured Pseudoteredinibacter sp.]